MKELKFIEVSNEIERAINKEGMTCIGIYVYSFYKKIQKDNKLGNTKVFDFSITGLNEAIILYNNIITNEDLQYVAIGIDYNKSNFNEIGGAKDLFAYTCHKKAV